MMDVFGNYVVQKLFEVCDQTQKVDIAGKMEGNVFKLSMEMYGCRVGHSLLFFNGMLMSGGTESFRACLEGSKGSTCRRTQGPSHRLRQGQQR
jgi:hypothetical protein